MLEKIHIDSIEENALIEYKKQGYTFSDFACGTPMHILDPSFTVLSIFTAEEFAYLLHGWYVVIEPARLNHWYRYEGSYRKVSDVDHKYVYFYHPKNKNLPFMKVTKTMFHRYAREVTHRWEALLLDLGRPYPAPQIGDVYLDEDGIHLLETMEDCFTKALPAWNNETIIKYYPHEVGFKK